MLNGKKATLLGLIPAVLVLLAGCASSSGTDPETASPVPQPPYRAEILLDGISAQIIGRGAALQDGVLTVTEAGVYRLAGEFDGAVRVEVPETEDGPAEVELVLDGVSVTGSGCALYAARADSLRLTLAAGTENLLSDGARSALPDGSAAVYARCPLTIGGEGSLAVSGLGGGGILSRRALTLESGTVSVSAASDGFSGRGSVELNGGTLTLDCGGSGVCAGSVRGAGGDVTVNGGTLTVTSDRHGVRAKGSILLADGVVTVTAGGDGMHAQKDLSVSGGTFRALTADEGLQAGGALTVSGGELGVTAEQNGFLSGGSLTVSGGTIRLKSGTDALQAVTELTVSGGELTVEAGGGGGNAISHSDAGSGMGFGGRSAASATDLKVGKGLKCDGGIVITDGVLDLNSSDDAIHSGADVRIDGGTLAILTNDDAVHGDDSLTVNGGSIDIRDCFEGLEAPAIDLNGGDISLRAVNDGVNANGAEGSGEVYVRMTGGTLDLVITGNAGNLGDGIDSNGSFYFDGGTATVSTFGGTMENGVDIGNTTFVVTGGILVSGGSSTMAEGPSANSTQCCALVNLNGLSGANAAVTLTDSRGNVIYQTVLTNTCNSVVVTHPDLQVGQVYTLTVGSQTKTLDFTTSNVINQGEGMGGIPGGGRMF